MLKDKTGKHLSRSEGEAIMKGRSSVVISICAALLAVAAMLSNSNSSRILIKFCVNPNTCIYVCTNITI